MNNLSYWKKQGKQPLFTDIDTERPEQKQFAGNLVIIGGNSGAFFAPASTTAKAAEQGIGSVRTVLPDSLKKKIPLNPETIFAPSSPSGGFNKDAAPLLRAAADQSDFVLIIGDLGKNAETATTLADFLNQTTKPTLLTRDTIDLLAPDAATWITKPKLTLFATMPQLQKLFRAVYYPKVITLSMPLNQLIETLHKFTLSYPATILTYHQNQLILAGQGNIITTDISDTTWSPITLWNGDLAARIARLQIWNPTKLFAATATAII
jgi:hypothetical protein